MPRLRLVLQYALAAVTVVVAVAYFTLLWSKKPAEPTLSSHLQQGMVRVADRDRTFAYYAPANLPANAPLVVALHGSGESGESFRWHIGYRFDVLADAKGFVVVYPDGFEHHWNDCRRVASYSARTAHVDDVAFVRALVDRLHATLGIDPSKVFAFGHSNGGQMSLRLALEAPDLVRGVASISASLPAPDNLDCKESGRPVAVLVMNGTADPINPYDGGRVTLFGFGDRGTVLSSRDTALYFAGLALVAGSAHPVDPIEAASIERIHGGDPSMWVERTAWGLPGKGEVVLDAIHGGGHVVPQPVTRYARVLGPTDMTFDGPGEIWSFFARQLPSR